MQYLDTQLRLEGLRVNPSGRIEPVDATRKEIPLTILAQLEDGERVVYPGCTLPAGFIEKLPDLIPLAEFPQVAHLLAGLKELGYQPRYGHYKTYTFPPVYATAAAPQVEVYAKGHPLIRALGFGFSEFGEPVYATGDEQEVYSACVSTLENGECAECWVYTSPDYRGRGLAQQVVTAWAKSILNSQRIPYYSHKIENLASAGLARKLGLIPLFEEINIEHLP